jgi:hypothetical protein
MDSKPDRIDDDVDNSQSTARDGRHKFPVAEPHDTRPPLESIRRKCMKCMGGSGAAVAMCANEMCPLWAFRLCRKPNPKAMDRSTVVLPPEKGVRLGKVLDHHSPRRIAIRLMCLDCRGLDRKEIAACTTWACPLYPYRLGPGRAADRGDVVARQALWRQVGHEEYTRPIVTELYGHADADLRSAELAATGPVEDDAADPEVGE